MRLSNRLQKDGLLGGFQICPFIRPKKISETILKPKKNTSNIIPDSKPSIGGILLGPVTKRAGLFLKELWCLI